MTTNKAIQLRIGRTYTVTTTVSGIDDWTDKNAVLYAARSYGGDAVLEKAGTIAIDTGVVSFELTAAETKVLSGKYKYEITVYENDGSFVKDVNYGDIVMENVVDSDPTA